MGISDEKKLYIIGLISFSMEEILLAEHNDDPKFEHVSFAHPIKKSVLTIIGKEGDLLMPAGTSFIITADGLMMTARHVIDEIYPDPCKYDLIQLSKQYPARGCN